MRESVINFNRKLKVQITVCRGKRAESFAKHSNLHPCVRKFKHVEGFTLVTENVGQDLGGKKIPTDKLLAWFCFFLKTCGE